MFHVKIDFYNLAKLKITKLNLKMKTKYLVSRETKKSLTIRNSSGE